MKLSLTIFVVSLALASAAYVQTNLVSDLPNNAIHTDPALINPWGLAAFPNGSIVVTDTGTGIATVYDPNGTPLGINITIPAPTSGLNASSTSRPTGVVAVTEFLLNVTTISNLSSCCAASSNRNLSNTAQFIFATEDGTLAVWTSAFNSWNAITVADLSSFRPTSNDTVGAVYKGVTVARLPSGEYRIYAANFRHNRIDVWDKDFRRLEGLAFTDLSLPSGYAPFNIYAYKDKLYVAFALQDSLKEDDVPGEGLGYVSVFSTDGNLITSKLIAKGKLNAPWGMAVSPCNFGEFSDRLLVGNFGDGRIHAYNKDSGEFIGTLTSVTGPPLVLDGLWGLLFVNTNCTSSGSMYFAAGVQREQHGLVGTIDTIGRFLRFFF